MARLVSDIDACGGLVLLAGNCHRELTNLVAGRLQVKLCDANVYTKPNRETAVEIRDSVRNKHVFILQSISKDVNNNVMELLILTHACRTSVARTITAVVPYLPYSKQCRMFGRSSIPMKLLADLIVKAGADRLISLDLFRKEIQGFFSIPVDNLRASPFLLSYIHENIPDYKNAVIVAKSPDVMHKAMSYAERLRLDIAVIHGESKDDLREPEDGRQSPPAIITHEEDERFEASAEVARKRNRSGSNVGMTQYNYLPQMFAKEKPPLTVVGDVGGRIAIIVDDIFDEAKSFVAAAEVLKQRGAYKIYVIVTHGLLSAGAPDLLEGSAIDKRRFRLWAIEDDRRV
ncbi:hypothetical protein AB6A40_009040 [Gnathostoma spinigerum]|uniref:Ribose-phosphate pyrophosphokinase N-terminal domain-containing protein n=1 Tax=Gnathostoma spinigerum TaxID=75299 RepID=A0ABD6EXX3_9BILA